MDSDKALIEQQRLLEQKRLSLGIGSALLLAGALGLVVPRYLSRREVSSSDGMSLPAVVPSKFGEWAQDFRALVPVVNPQTQQLLDKLYSQLLNRQYLSADGYRIMLSMAYGKSQKGDLQAHRPETCYPAQGFQLISNIQATMQAGSAAIPVRRLRTEQAARKEPVTYWFTMGDQVVDSGFDRRLVELRYKLTGLIPDGLLVRISSIDNDSNRAFVKHDAFVRDWLSAVSAPDRVRLTGQAGFG